MSSGNGTDLQDSMVNSEKSDFLIVGIGASAGGIKALQVFFKNVTKNSGVAYVVILHLAPDFDSQLTSILQREAEIPVKEVTKSVEIKPDHVYVVSPAHHLKIEGNLITVSDNIQLEERLAPIDIFFRSLAEVHRSRAIAVVLSGTGADGSMGLKRVKERGGSCFVQNPNEAEFHEMPQHAISTGLVDEVLSVVDIPKKIISFKTHLGKVQITEKSEDESEEQQTALREILTHLHLRTGHDFTNYKRPTILRRMERRIVVHNLPGLSAYATFVKDKPEESTALMKDLLISVTNFFRDKTTFDYIADNVLPQIFKNKGAKDQVRIWVAGCATGEEAYSLAMLCAEITLGVLDAPQVQIFATDIDEPAIAHARYGLYTLNDTADVSPERLRMFFIKDGTRYRIRKEIRETVNFATHNVIKDPAFSHLDLVSCRNLMIYLNSVAQERVIKTFHFALNPNGFLIFGNSESMDGDSDLFSIYHRENHIFRRSQVHFQAYPIPHSSPVFDFENMKKDTAIQEKNLKTLNRISFGDLHQQLLEEYAPPSLVINENYDIVHLTAKAGKYLQITGGELSKNLLDLIKPELRLKLRSTLKHATIQQTAASAGGLKVKLGDTEEILTIHVRPVTRSKDSANSFILVIFEPDTKVTEPITFISPDEPLAKQIEEELINVKAQLRSANEQHNYQAEEMKATNEELQVMNEELQTTAEELETSKEELQSINEELRTVNQELKLKIEETSIAKNHLENVIDATDVGTIFLDQNFRISLYTPAATIIFKLIPADNGRHLEDITHKLNYQGILNDAATVLEKLKVVEKEITSHDGNSYLMRVAPYNTDENRIVGVVITFVNITQSKLSDEALRKSEERLRVTMESAVDFVIITLDTKGLIEQWNSGAQQILGYTAEEVQDKAFDIIFSEEDRKNEIPKRELDNAHHKGLATDERWHRRKDGSLIYMSGIVRPIYNPDLSGYVKVARDMTSTKLNQEQLRISEERHRIALDSAGMSAWDWNVEADTMSWNENHHTMLGMEPATERKNISFFEKFVHVEDRERIKSSLKHAVATAGEFLEEFRIISADNKEVVWVKGYGSTVTAQNGQATRMVGVMLDITDQKLFTEELSKQVDKRTMELQRSNEDLQQFAHVASHDLKEPVRKIRTFYSRIMEEYEDSLPKEVISILERIESAAERMYAMIEGVLRYSELGNDPENLKKVNLNEIIDEIETDLEVLIASKNATISREELPHIYAGPLLIYQLFYNLILNSLKFAKEDEPSRITITASKFTDNGNRHIKITVADNGIGFDEKHSKKIFTTFTRLNRADLYDGSGLGLSLCKKIVERYNGTITATGKLNEGAKFTIQFPITQ